MKKTLITIFALLAIGLLAWYANAFFSKKGTSQVVPGSNLDKLVDENKTESTTAEKIIFATQDTDKKEVIQSNTNSEKTTIFTDKDEEGKIKRWGGLSNLAKLLLLDIGDGKLETVKVDEPRTRETIMEKFGVPQTLQISPDGKQIAYVSFSNAEADYGFGLYQMAKNGSNLRQILHSDQEIKNLAWNQDSSKIIFSQSIGDKTEIKVADIPTNQIQSILETSQAVLGISVSAKNKIVFSVADPKNLATNEIDIMDLDGKNNQKIYSIKDRAALYPCVSSDFTYLAYLAVEVKDNKIDKNSSSDVTLVPIGKNKTKTIGSANQIFGWLQ